MQLLWIHPIAKKYVLMPDGDSNVLFCSIGIASVGTCPPLAMNFKTHFFDSLTPPCPGGSFLSYGKKRLLDILQSGVVLLAGADLDHFGYVVHEDLAIADMPGVKHFLSGLNDLGHRHLADHNIHLDLG